MLKITLHPAVRPVNEADPLLQALLADIEANEQDDPVLCVKGPHNGDHLVIDGAKRLWCCQKLGRAVKFTDWDGDPSKVEDEIVRRKLLREHFSPSQRAAFAVRHRVDFSLGAPERQRAGCKAEVNLAAKLQQGSPGRSLDKAAKAFGASARYCFDALWVKQRDLRLFQKIEAGELTTSQAKAILAQREREKAAEADKRAASRVRRSPLNENLQLILGDNRKVLADPTLERATLTWGDPPYNNGWHYDADPDGDRRDDDEYLGDIFRVACLARENLRDNGTLCFLINDEYDEQFGSLLRKTEMHRRTKIVWWKHFPVNQEADHPEAAKYVHVYTKKRKGFVWHPPRVESIRNAIGDTRATSAGKVPDNVWPIYMVPSNSKERAPFSDMPPQVPLELVFRFILTHTNPGDLVIDPYNGNGITALAALLAGRRAIGIDRSEKYLKQSEQLIAEGLKRGLTPRLRRILEDVK